MFEFNKPQANEFEKVPAGQYEGCIVRCEVGKTQKGDKTLKIKIKSDGHRGYHFVDLNMDHEKAKPVSMKNISSILYGALVAPPQSLQTLEDICAFLTDLPVNYKIAYKIDKEGKERTNTYFNDCAVKLQAKEQVKATASSGTAW